MKIGFLFTLITTLLTGCHATPEVYMPVSQQHSITMPERQELKLKSLSSVSSPDKVVKAYVASMQQLKGENEELRLLLEGYQ